MTINFNIVIEYITFYLIFYQQNELPQTEDLDIYQAWDLAISTRETADYTVCTTVGVADDNQIYVLDRYRDRIDFPIQVNMVEKLAQKYDPLQIGIESNAPEGTPRGSPGIR